MTLARKSVAVRTRARRSLPVRILAVLVVALALGWSGATIGHGAEDDSAVIKLYAALSGITLPQPAAKDGQP